MQDDFSISQYTTYIGGNAVRTESEAFNKAYSIRGNDGHSIFYLLTPHYMEKLLVLSNEIGKRLAMQFRKDGKLKFRSEVRYVTELIDALLAVDTLYKQ